MAKRPFPKLETPRLILRPFTRSDAASLYAYRNDPEVARYQSWEGVTRAQASAFVAAQAKQPVGVASAWLQVALELKATGEHIGDVAFCPDGEGQATVGYTLGSQHQGEGYASEALSRLLEYLFDELRLHRVVATLDSRNVRSARLLERLGFRREGSFVENVYFKGEWCDEYLYALLAREWASRRALNPY